MNLSWSGSRVMPGVHEYQHQFDAAGFAVLLMCR